MLTLLATTALLTSAVAHASGEVLVRTSPAGAGLRVDGEGTPYVSPASLQLSPGVHRIDAALGCDRGWAEVVVQSGQTVEVELPLKRATGTVTFLPRPAAMTITIDGMPVSRSDRPVEVPCGEHRVKATLEGATPVVLSLDVGPGQNLSLPIELEVRGTGSIAVDVSPEIAIVSLDGEEQGMGDRVLADIPEGPHQIAVVAEGYTSTTRNLVLGAGELREERIDLQPIGPLAEPRAPLDGAKIGRIAGWSSIGIGTGLLALAGYQYLSHRDEWDQYQQYGEAVERGELSPAAYDAYYESQLAPAHRTTLVSGISGGMVLGLGLGLVLVF